MAKRKRHRTAPDTPIPAAPPELEQLYGFSQKAVMTPEYWQVTLDVFRQQLDGSADGGLDVREDIRQFLADTRGVTGRAIVAVTKYGVSLLTDEAGNLLEFA